MVHCDGRILQNINAVLSNSSLVDAECTECDFFLTEIYTLLNRVARSQFGGQQWKPSNIVNSHQLVMCGATGLSCGRSCPTGNDLTGTCRIKM